jgi:hypothetical protein
MAQPTVTLTATIDNGGVSGKPMSLNWMSRIGPALVRFSAANAATTDATFTEPGAYLLHVFADNGHLAAGDLVAVYVHPRLPDKGPIRVEAEHMLLEAYGVEAAPFASGGKYVWQRSGMTSTLAICCGGGTRRPTRKLRRPRRRRRWSAVRSVSPRFPRTCCWLRPTNCWWPK